MTLKTLLRKLLGRRRPEIEIHHAPRPLGRRRPRPGERIDVDCTSVILAAAKFRRRAA